MKPNSSAMMRRAQAAGVLTVLMGSSEKQTGSLRESLASEGSLEAGFSSLLGFLSRGKGRQPRQTNSQPRAQIK